VTDGRDDGPSEVEDFTLADGSAWRMRPLRAEDRVHLVAGLERMSAQSRYLRFFTAKSRLTESELRYLSEVDGYKHYAVGICRMLPDGTEGEGVAVARFARLPDDQTVAEPAVAVIDEMQGRGFGRRLMVRLVHAAAARGVLRFRTEFLAVNDSMRDLLEGLELPAGGARFVADGPIVVAEFPVVDTPASPDPAPLMYEWFRLVAQRAIEFRRIFSMLLDPVALMAAWQRARHELHERVRGPTDEA